MKEPKTKPSTPTSDREMLADKLLLTKSQVAQILGCSEVTVEGLHSSGVMRACMLGKRLMWKPAWLTAYVAKLQQAD